MAHNTIARIYEKVNRLLDTRSLHEAFFILKNSQAALSDARLSEKINSLEETYKYLIHYFIEGFDDSGREKMLADITEQLHSINDTIKRNLTMADSPDLYSSTRRFENVRKATLSTRLSAYRDAYLKSTLATDRETLQTLTKDADEALSALFSYIWTMYGAEPKEYRLLSESISSSELPFEFKSQAVSALLLGNLSYYDRNALTTLIDIYEADSDEKLCARTLVAILLILAAHPSRIKSDPKLHNRLELWKDSIITYRRLREVVMNIIRSHDTQRISSKMKNEVIPELMKIRPEILSKLKNITQEADADMLEANPEWEEILSKNGLGEKLKELTDMQMDGGDVMMMAFSNLKNFPFFNNIANWFLPYSPTHSELSQSMDLLGDLTYLLDIGGLMCDSDKYSFALSLIKMPEAQRKMMSSRMEGQMAQIKEAIADKKLKSSLPEFDAEVTRYVRNIYRFFKLFRRKDEFNDPFSHPIDFMNLPFVADILNDDEILNLIGEFYFKRGYYAEALPILELQEKNNEANPLTWEKIGYCHNALNNFEQAIIWYRKAELLNPDSLWLTKKLALCNRLINRYEEASEYYAKALKCSPDNYSLLMSAGKCRLETGDIKDALSDFYHADYVKPGKMGTLRAIAWGELLNADYFKSLEYYKKITSMPEAGFSDFVNNGHAHYLSGNIKKAVECYVKGASMPGGNILKVEDEIRNDTDIILKAGGSKDELRLILDKVGYEVNSPSPDFIEGLNA